MLAADGQHPFPVLRRQAVAGRIMSRRIKDDQQTVLPGQYSCRLIRKRLQIELQFIIKQGECVQAAQRLLA